ncbi:response regulator [Aestuariibaculum sediminum]|uniref:Response regulator n=1 Tax=Aestuariibaculum sediminum TaxID=2770637 RepID=A0A8J6Q3V0_9FLAO|nr:response regulator [Aestuariibaculum sediminum]MBD0832735.1 response regulator [Aestuariibaculum sediminum]
MNKALKILFIDDDVIEAMKFNRVVSSLKLNHEVIEAKNGEEALQILNDKENLPDIILLDLNMPKLNGIDFLKILKSDDILNYVPTIVLTTSNNPNDLKACYKIGVAGYVKKPLKYEDYVLKIQNLISYWSMNELVEL